MVVFTGDHGWELGEHGEFCKRTNFEIGLRVPYMIRSPRHAKSSYGKATRGFAESLDFYRTLVGLAAPSLSVHIEPSVEGLDLTSLFETPELPAGETGPHNASFSQMARCPCGNTWPCFSEGIESACNSVERNNTPFMGYTVRIKGFRYTEWVAFNASTNQEKESKPDWNRTVGSELYVHDDAVNSGEQCVALLCIFAVGVR